MISSFSKRDKLGAVGLTDFEEFLLFQREIS
jgi:hypothetical protein